MRLIEGRLVEDGVEGHAWRGGWSMSLIVVVFVVLLGGPVRVAALLEGWFWVLDAVLIFVDLVGQLVVFVWVNDNMMIIIMTKEGQNNCYRYGITVRA